MFQSGNLLVGKPCLFLYLLQWDARIRTVFGSIRRLRVRKIDPFSDRAEIMETSPLTASIAPPRASSRHTGLFGG